MRVGTFKKTRWFLLMVFFLMNFAGLNYAAGDKELRISVQAWMMGKYRLQEAAEDFMAKHPGVKVTINRVESWDTTSYILQWSQGKTNCDLVLGGSREQAVLYAAKNYILNFDKGFFDSKLKKEDFVPAFLELGNIEGTQYMIPMLGEVMFLVVNKNLMKKAGLTDEKGNIKPPATWAELYECGKKATLVDNGNVVQTGLSIDWGDNFMTYSYLAGLQGLRGSIYEADQKTIDFTSKEAKELLSIWVKLVKDGYSPVDTFTDRDAGRTNFKAGKVALHLTAHSRWVEASDLLGSANVTVLPIPGTEKNGTLTYIHGGVIPKLSKVQNLAKQFIKEELLDKDFQMYSVNKYGKMSPLKAHYKTALAGEWKVVLDTASKAITCPLYKDWNKLDKTVLVEFQKCLSGKQSVDETSANLKRFVDSIDKSTGLK